MAITWIEGFDLYTSGNGVSGMPLRYTVQNSPSLSTGRFGVGLAGSFLNSGLTWGITATDTLAHGFAIKFDALGNHTIFRYQNAGSNINEIAILSTGAVRWTQNGTTKGTSTVLISSGAWNYLEVELTRHASTGAVTVYLNGTAILTLTGQNLGASSIDMINMQGQNDGVTMHLDDMYLTNTAAKLGECRVDTLRPSAETADQDWTPSTGTNNAANVDDSTYDNDTTYNSASVAGDLDIYDVSNLLFTPTSVVAVQTLLNVRKDDATFRSVRSKVRSGGTDGNGATRTLGTSYQVYADIYPNDPNTGSAWAVAAVNAAQLGVEVIA
jgi:hypothetical protein